MWRLRQEDFDSVDMKYDFVETWDATSFEVQVSTKCHKISSSTEDDEFDKWHHEKLEDMSTHVKCTRCDSKKPGSLQRLCCLRLLEKGHLPRDLLLKLPPLAKTLLLDTAVNCLLDPTEESSFQRIKPLLSAWPFEVCNVEYLNRRERGDVAITRLVLNQFVATHHSRVAQETIDSALKHLVITNGRGVQFRCLCYRLTQIADGDEMSISKEDTGSYGTYIVTTNVFLRSFQELQEFILLTRNLRRKRIPVELRAVGIWIEDVDHYDIGTLFREISPEFVEELHGKWQNFSDVDLEELALVISDCSSLQDLRLEVKTAAESDVALTVAIGMMNILTKSKTIKRLTLNGFPIAGYGGRYYVLPSGLTAFHLITCTLEYTDFGAWARKCEASSIKTLRISDCTLESRGDDTDNLYDFVRQHAASLISVSMDIKGSQPSMEVLRCITEHLARKQILQQFTYENATRDDLIDILKVSLPWVMNNESLLRFKISTGPSTETDSDELRDLVRRSLKALFARKRRLMLFGSVRYFKAYY